jgi:hypothetical protein
MLLKHIYRIVFSILVIFSVVIASSVSTFAQSNTGDSPVAPVKNIQAAGITLDMNDVNKPNGVEPKAGEIINTGNGVTANSNTDNATTNTVSDTKITPTAAAASTSKAKADELNTVRTGSGISVFMLVMIPVAIMLYYQYKYITDKKSSLQSKEQKINTKL